MERSALQNRYTGDIGDFAKYGLLRALGAGLRLGVAWYLFPDESHNGDGRHIDYLKAPERWRRLDPALFDTLNSVVSAGRREVAAIEDSGVLGNARFAGALLDFRGDRREREQQRAAWFRGVLADIAGCDLVFADPDNGLSEDAGYRPGERGAWKRIPVSEAQVLAAGRTAVIYHHNTRRPGGHLEEIRHWLGQFGEDALALYWRRHSPRTFFILRPTDEIRRRAEALAERWAPHFQLHTSERIAVGVGAGGARTPSVPQIQGEKLCPECGHLFNGTGWGGIDAHWKARHSEVMPYEEAWPLIRAGRWPRSS